MTFVRLLDTIPYIYERISLSASKLSGSSLVFGPFDYKWLSYLVDLGNSSLLIVKRRWKQCLLALMNIFKGSCNGSILCMISVIEVILSCDTVSVQNLKNEVLNLINSLSKASRTIDGKIIMPDSSFSQPNLVRQSSVLDVSFCSGKEGRAENAELKQRLRDQDVIVLSDDEATCVAFPKLASSSVKRTNEQGLGDRLPAYAVKVSLSGRPAESTNITVSEDILAPFPSRIFSEESPVSSQEEQGSNVFDIKGLSSKLGSSVSRSTTSILQSKGAKKVINCMTSASDIFRSAKNANSSCKGSSSHSVKNQTSNQVSSSRTSKNDSELQKDNALVMELVSDDVDDPLEHALNNLKRPQTVLTKSTITVPKRKVIQLQMPTNNRSGVNRLGTRFRRLKPPRLDDWYRPILELDYFSIVGLSHSKDERNAPLSNLKEVPLCFKSVEHYVEIFQPLVLEEFKAQLHSSYLETSPDDMYSDSLCILSVERVDDFHFVRGRPDNGNSAGSKGFSDNDLVLLTKKPLQNSVQDVHMLGKVERRDKSNKSQSAILVIRFYLMNGSSHSNKVKKLLIERSKWSLSRVMSITPQIREFQALSSLHDIPMLPIILNPVERYPRGHESRKVELSKLAKPLQNVFKSSFNRSQLEAISIAVGTHTSMSSFELCLIQGPPGTGKTRTIVATVSALLSLHAVQDNYSSKTLNSNSRTISALCTNPKVQISQSAAIARAWQDAALAKQIIKESEKSSGQTECFTSGRVLICAQSNAAVDELVSRISEGLYGNDGKLYRPYLVRVGNAKTVHPNSERFFIDRLVEQRLADDSSNHANSKNEVNAESSSSLRSKLEKLVDNIRHYESRRAKLDSSDISTNNSSDTGACNGDDAQEVSDAALGAKLNVLYEQKRSLCAELAAAQSQEKKASEESWSLRNKIRKSILMEANIVITTLSGCGGDLNRVCSESASISKFGRFSEQCLFDVVIIDEAAQALEPATLIPLQLLKSIGTQCIMVGDPKQLPATVISDVASKFLYECSMFERLQRAGHPVVMLMEQYRMHPEICRFPSSHFYENKLLNGAQMASKSVHFHENACLGPYMFFDVFDGHEHHGKNSASLSLYNESEVEAAVRLLQFLRSRYPSEFALRKIGIITPYRSQLALLRSRFSSAFGSDVVSEMEFNTVDGFQGREVDILLLSTVRASDSTSSTSIGFVADVRRMNVALTRAKFSLWIVGNARTLQQNPHWGALINNAKERKLFISISRPYDSVFVNAKPASGANRFSKSNSHSTYHPKNSEKVRHRTSGKEVLRGRTDILDGKSDQHSKGSQNYPNDNSSFREVAPKHPKDRESTKRRHPPSSFEGENNLLEFQKALGEGTDEASQKNGKCRKQADEVVQDVQFRTDSSTKELIQKAKEVRSSSKHYTSNKSSIVSSAEEKNRLSDEGPIKKIKEVQKSPEHVESSKLRRQSSSLAASAKEGSDKALAKKAKEGGRLCKIDTSSNLGSKSSVAVVSPTERNQRLSDKALGKKAKEGQKFVECVTSSELSQKRTSPVASRDEGSFRLREAHDRQPHNSKVKAKGSCRFSEQGTIRKSSTLPSPLESKLLSDINEDRASNIVDAPKKLMATRKRQRDDVDALLSSALISSKKTGGSSRLGSVDNL